MLFNVAAPSRPLALQDKGVFLDDSVERTDTKNVYVTLLFKTPISMCQHFAIPIPKSAVIYGCS